MICSFTEHECCFLPAGTIFGLSLTDICRLWVYPPDMTTCSKKKHPGQSTVGNRKHIITEAYDEEGDNTVHTQSQVVISVSVHTFSASVMPNNTAKLCPHKGLKSLNRFTVICQLIHEQVNVTALSQPQDFAPKCKCMFSFAVVTEIRVIRRKLAQTRNCS